MNTRLPVGERLRVWELTTDRITRVSPWVTVKGVGTRATTVQLVCYWFTVVGVETRTTTVQLACYWGTVKGVGTRTATASLVLTGGLRLRV